MVWALAFGRRTTPNQTFSARRKAKRSRFIEIKVLGNQASKIKLKSLIMAQIERWRHA